MSKQGYGPGWSKLEILVHPGGEIHFLNGEGDRPFRHQEYVIHQKTLSVEENPNFSELVKIKTEIVKTANRLDKLDDAKERLIELADSMLCTGATKPAMELPSKKEVLQGSTAHVDDIVDFALGVAAAYDFIAEKITK